MLSISTPLVSERHALSLTRDEYLGLAIIDQLRVAFRPGHRLAALTGLVLGGIIPGITWTIVHFEVTATPALWILAGGGLLYSAITVFDWVTATFGNSFKSTGFVVLLEGALAFSHILAVSLTVLGVLVFINGVSAACALQVRPDSTVTSDTAVQSLGLLHPPSVTVNIAHQNITTPERTPSRPNDDARRAASAKRAREYRKRKRNAIASQRVTVEGDGNLNATTTT